MFAQMVAVAEATTLRLLMLIVPRTQISPIHVRGVLLWGHHAKLIILVLSAGIKKLQSKVLGLYFLIYCKCIPSTFPLI